MSSQLAPLEPPFPPEVDAILATYPQLDGYIIALFRTFANSIRFLRKAVPNLLDKESPLDLRTREIVILRTTANRNCEYEWGVHVAVFAKAAGLSEEQIQATHVGSADDWQGREARLIAAIDRLCCDGNLDTQRLAHFRSDWNREEQLEILALIGTYTTISLVANSAELPPEPFAARFPDRG